MEIQRLSCSHTHPLCVCVCLRKKVLDIKANLNSLALQ